MANYKTGKRHNHNYFHMETDKHARTNKQPKITNNKQIYNRLNT